MARVSLYSEDVRDEFRGMFGNLALQVLIDNFSFETVLDIGSGAGQHASIFEKYGKTVTAVDLGVSVYYDRRAADGLVADYNQRSFSNKFDCIWASHVLEHQTNPGTFLCKIKHDL